jgi:glycosyltransferase involved in cell wall biosynthesis
MIALQPTTHSIGAESLDLSIVMPCYNSRDYLGTAIESVLSQTFSDFELIIVDDGSTDGSDEIAARYAQRDQRVRLVSSGHQGAAVARNQGNHVARGSWIVVMDSDDVLLPHHLEKQLGFLSMHPEASVVACLPNYINTRGRILGRQFSEYRTHQDIAERIAILEPIMVPHPGCFMRREVVLALGGYRQEFCPSEDFDLINRIAQRGFVILVNHQVLFHYRIHARSVSVKDSRRAQTQVRWVAACMRARAADRPEPSWETFRQAENSEIAWQRWKQWRLDAASSFYKSGVAAYSNGEFLSLVPNMTMALALKPKAIPQLIWKRWARPRLETLNKWNVWSDNIESSPNPNPLSALSCSEEK